MAAKTLHKFPLLPFELRYAIWIFALQEPRLTTVRKKIQVVEYLIDPEILYYHSCDAPPPLTQVNSESRSAAMTVYTRTFQQGIQPRYTYLNFPIDTLIISDYDLCDPTLPLAVELQLIRKLVFIIPDIDEFPGFLLGKRGVNRMRKLEDFTGVTKEHGAEYRRRYNERMKSYFESVRRDVEGWTCTGIDFVRVDEKGSFGVEMIEMIEEDEF